MGLYLVFPFRVCFIKPFFSVLKQGQNRVFGFFLGLKDLLEKRKISLQILHIPSTFSVFLPFWTLFRGWRCILKILLYFFCFNLFITKNFFWILLKWVSGFRFSENWLKTGYPFSGETGLETLDTVIFYSRFAQDGIFVLLIMEENLNWSFWL